MKLSLKTQYIFDEVKKIISPVYLVGGSVRDELLERDSNDYDFTTPLSPDEIEERVHKAGKRAFIVDKRFGTIAFKVEYEKVQYMVEVTTFRAEKYNENDRKPEVEFVNDIVKDLSRRDFTINSMAIREDGRLLDPFHGKQDLDDKFIRAVGNPTIRFKEDPLRLLRACRFTAQLGFGIEEKTYNSIKKNAHRILSVSKERWVQEMDKLLMSDYSNLGLEELWVTNLFLYMIPELELQ
jgi:tRNA nucleotidyltransferase/poly(A) polymerase